jgi:hypothetical protein
MQMNRTLLFILIAGLAQSLNASSNPPGGAPTTVPFYKMDVDQRMKALASMDLGEKFAAMMTLNEQQMIAMEQALDAAGRKQNRENQAANAKIKKELTDHLDKLNAKIKMKSTPELEELKRAAQTALQAIEQMEKLHESELQLLNSQATAKLITSMEKEMDRKYGKYMK